MNVIRTARGFERIDFRDQYGIECSLQQSSLASPPCVWLGCNDADPRVLLPGKGWTQIEMPSGYIADTRMHLNRKQVKALVARLNRWLEAGTFKR